MLRSVLALLLLASVAPGAPAGAADERTPNITVEKRLPYTGGTELAYDGRYVYAGQWAGKLNRFELPRQGGVRIIDTQASPPKVVGMVPCPATDVDVAVPRAGVLVIAHHASFCGVRGDGVTVFDVRNPAKPKKLSSLAVPSAHTLTAVPGTNLLYVSPGGLRNGDGLTAVVDVTDAKRPKLRGTIRPDLWGCHDVTFGRTLTGTLLGACAGGAGVRLWDLTNPVKPKTLSMTPAWQADRGYQIQFPHGAAISSDGLLMVVNDEAYAYHRCDGEDPEENGSLHVYDISDPGAPRYLGRIVPPRGRYDAASRSGGVGTWCTSHQLNFAPNSRRLVNAWFTGGVSVWDLTIPTMPREEAYYVGSGAVTWTAHWFGDRIWVNDMARGLEVLKLSLLPTGGPVVSPAWRPASQPAAVPFRRRPLPAGVFVCKT